MSQPNVPMTSPNDAMSRARWLRIVAVLSIAGAIAVAAVVLSQPKAVEAPRTSTVEDGGLEWQDVTVLPVDGDGATVTAQVDLDGEGFPAATSRDDRFVMFQLGDGRFDEDAHVDDAAAERMIGLDDDDNVQLYPTAEADGASLPAGSGRYAMSLDGTIEYRDIPAGEWELRAIVVDRTGAWSGEHATRMVRVP
jgi:hypothetical protein